MIRDLQRAGAAALGVALCAGALYAPVVAQSVEASRAAEYLGSWVATVETEIGSLQMTLDVEDRDGVVAARVGTADLGTVEAQTVALTDAGLVIEYGVDMQGQIIDVVLTVSRSGEELAYSLVAASGSYQMSGTARRASG